MAQAQKFVLQMCGPSVHRRPLNSLFLSVLLMSHRFVARANLGTVCGARPCVRARISSCSWGPGPVRPRSRGRSLDAGLGDRPDATSPQLFQWPSGSGSALHRAPSFGVQNPACDIPPWMRDAPKRRRLDDVPLRASGWCSSWRSLG